jgi:hypothetical protein
MFHEIKIKLANMAPKIIALDRNDLEEYAEMGAKIEIGYKEI